MPGQRMVGLADGRIRRRLSSLAQVDQFWAARHRQQNMCCPAQPRPFHSIWIHHRICAETYPT